MHIPITKMQGAGNDFILVDNRQLKLSAKQKVAFAKKFCVPKISVGGDGAIFLEKHGNDLAWDFYNADGSSADMCGNGARCFARYAVNIGAAKSPFTFRTLAGMIKAQITAPHRARVQLTPASPYQIVTDGEKFTGYFINTGVPHLVIIVDEVNKINVQKYGGALRHHRVFKPDGTNVNFITVDKKTRKIFMRTYERGVEAETLACGTGAVAAAIIAGEILKIRGAKKVYPRSGDVLNIKYKKSKNGYDDIFLEGPVEKVFDGIVNW